MLLRSASLLVFAGLIVYQSALHAQQPEPGSPSSGLTATATPDLPTDRRQQMRADLNQMESLMNNMQSEINFLRDQNLQILLNTNVRMWTILIRDLRAQLDDEERKPAPDSHSPAPKSPKP